MTHPNRIDLLKRARRPWLTDGGLETALIFNDGIDIPHFAAFHLLEAPDTRAAMTRYFERFIAIAIEAGTGFVLDTSTWRAGTAWTSVLGRDETALRQVNHDAVAYCMDLRRRHETAETPIVIEGIVGPAGDGYSPEALLTPDASDAIHAGQIGWLAEAGADVVSALTMTHAGEAIGFIRAAKRIGIPCIVGFTTETDGHLPDGETLSRAIQRTDAETGGGPLYYLVNCAHPDHFADALEGNWIRRIGGIRANASRLSHAELDACETLDEGDPEEFGLLNKALARRLPGLKVMGGCCGTDDRHVGCVARHVLSLQTETV